MRVELMIAHRHIIRRWKQSLLVLASITLGVAAVITVLSVTNGFQADLTERVLGLTSHLVVVPMAGPVFGDPDRVMQEIAQIPEIVGAAPGIFTQGLVSFKGSTKSVQIRGIVPEAESLISPALRTLTVGDITEFAPNQVLLGKGVASWLGTTIDDWVWITFPSRQTEAFQVTAVFDSGVAQYDNGFAYLCLEDVQRLLSLSQGVGEIRVQLSDPFRAEAVAEDLRDTDSNIGTITWRELNRNLFDALLLEKRVFALVLSLMLIVAGFGIANVLGMHVWQRQRDIAILSTMGLCLRKIRYAFILQGVFLGIIGALAGCALGILLSWSIDVFGLPLPQDLYPVDAVPVQIRLMDILLAFLGGVTVSALASYFPARRISASMPAEVLRHG
ncbi:MAG: ABC transporter permease [Firmicutes bacterium]|nr:ABC transporter permease [Bacillota bacterium]